MRKIITPTLSLVAISLLGLTLSGCGGGGGGSASSTTTNDTVSDISVFVEDGTILDANVSDSTCEGEAEEIGYGEYLLKECKNSTRDITVTGGIIDLDGNGIASSQDVKNSMILKSTNKNVTPITTLVYLYGEETVKNSFDINDTTTLYKLPSENLQIAASSQIFVQEKYSNFNTTKENNINAMYDISNISNLSTQVNTKFAELKQNKNTKQSEQNIFTALSVSKLSNAEIESAKCLAPDYTAIYNSQVILEPNCEQRIDYQHYLEARQVMLMQRDILRMQLNGITSKDELIKFAEATITTVSSAVSIKNGYKMAKNINKSKKLIKVTSKTNLSDELEYTDKDVFEYFVNGVRGSASNIETNKYLNAFVKIANVVTDETLDAIDGLKNPTHYIATKTFVISKNLFGVYNSSNAHDFIEYTNNYTILLNLLDLYYRYGSDLSLGIQTEYNQNISSNDIDTAIEIIAENWGIEKTVAWYDIILGDRYSVEEIKNNFQAMKDDISLKTTAFINKSVTYNVPSLNINQLICDQNSSLKNTINCSAIMFDDNISISNVNWCINDDCTQITDQNYFKNHDFNVSSGGEYTITLKASDTNDTTVSKTTSTNIQYDEIAISNISCTNTSGVQGYSTSCSSSLNVPSSNQLKKFYWCSNDDCSDYGTNTDYLNINIAINNVGKNTLTLKTVDVFGKENSKFIVLEASTPITYSWNTSDWGDCTGECGTNNATQTRTVTCQSSDGSTVADSLCTTTKPDISQSCTAGECNNTSTLQVPTNVTASQGAYIDRIKVSWDSVENATSYRVWYIGGAKSTSNTYYDDYIDTNYYYYSGGSKTSKTYTVQACNDNTCSEISETVLGSTYGN